MALSPGSRARMTTILRLALTFITVFLVAPASADLVNQTGQLTVFWGQHGDDEGSLRDACDSGMYTMVILSFLDVYGRGEYRLNLSGHPLGGMADDIRHCQNTGVLVSLAIGGFGGDYSLPTKQSALDLSDYLWNAFLCAGDSSGSNKTAAAGAGGWRDEHEPALRRRLPRRRRLLPRARRRRRRRGRALRHARHGPRHQEEQELQASPVPDRHAALLVPGPVRRQGAAGHGRVRPHPRALLRRPGLRRVLGAAVGQVDGGVPGQPQLPGAAAVGGAGRVLDLRQGPLLRRHARRAAGAQLRRRHMLWDRHYDLKSDYSSYVKYWA